VGRKGCEHQASEIQPIAEAYPPMFPVRDHEAQISNLYAGGNELIAQRMLAARGQLTVGSSVRAVPDAE
jgi:hypothetical protein